MTREEILKKSQFENKGKDVADIETSKNAFRAGWIVIIVLSAVVSVVDGIIFFFFAFELLFAECASLAVVFFFLLNSPMVFPFLRTRLVPSSLLNLRINTPISLGNGTVWYVFLRASIFFEI